MNKISVMIDSEIWKRIHDEICDPKTHHSDASKVIDEYINNLLYKHVGITSSLYKKTYCSRCSRETFFILRENLMECNICKTRVEK
jgi:hypothetical protein